MRISDWRSDVCSSDLRCQGVVGQISERSALSIAEPRQRHLVRQGDVRRRQAGEDAGWRSWGKRGVAGGADGGAGPVAVAGAGRSEEHTSELQSLMRISYAVFCLKKNILETKFLKLMP